MKGIRDRWVKVRLLRKLPMQRERLLLRFKPMPSPTSKSSDNLLLSDVGIGFFFFVDTDYLMKGQIFSLICKSTTSGNKQLKITVISENHFLPWMLWFFAMILFEVLFLELHCYSVFVLMVMRCIPLLPLMIENIKRKNHTPLW